MVTKTVWAFLCDLAKERNLIFFIEMNSEFLSWSAEHKTYSKQHLLS